MTIRRRAGLLVTTAAGLLVSVAALPAVAETASVNAPTDGLETADCTAARTAQDAYRVATVVPLYEDTGAVVDELQELVDAATEEIAVRSAALTAAEEVLAAAELGVETAQADLETATADGDLDEIAAAEAALAGAEDARDGAAEATVAAADELTVVELATADLELELADTQALESFLMEAALGRDFATEQELDDHVADLRAVDLGEYSDLVQELADACFEFAAPDGRDDLDEVDDLVVPAAPAATPVTARADYTG